MSGRSGFQVVEQTPPGPAPAPAAAAVSETQRWANAAAVEGLRLALAALSRRTVVAIANLFTLGLVASAWALWWRILPEPSVHQLIGVAGYSVFCLLIEVARRRA